MHVLTAAMIPLHHVKIR